MDATKMKEYLIGVILRRLDESPEGRQEALHEFMGISLPSVDEQSASSMARLIPEIPRSVYEKWATLFAERLIETVPHIQVEELCSGTEENNAAIALIYLMFMESERMEKQIAADLHTLGIKLSSIDEAGNALGAYLRARLASQKAPVQ